jgi:hypothetical protein
MSYSQVTLADNNMLFPRLSNSQFYFFINIFFLTNYASKQKKHGRMISWIISNVIFLSLVMLAKIESKKLSLLKI